MTEIVDVRELVGVSMNVRTASADSLPDRQVTLGALAFASDLGRLLWRMKYGQDVHRHGMNRAALLLSAMLRADRRYGKSHTRHSHATAPHSRTGAAYGDTVERLAYQALIEWIEDRCRGCGGHGFVGGKERSPGAYSARCTDCSGLGRRWLPGYRETSIECSECEGIGKVVVRPEPLKRELCRVCSGSGMLQIDAPSRARAIAVPVDVYHRHWVVRFTVAHAVLDEVDAWVETVFKEQRRA